MGEIVRVTRLRENGEKVTMRMCTKEKMGGCAFASCKTIHRNEKEGWIGEMIEEMKLKDKK